ncbi:MAG: PQQ-dependent sugar dehydrogenase, partial [Verrucomicrobiae bacterium]|nr:PQQ-dependent sugar dehydrogenase [Verrucomicrobiae bacterium]
MSGLKRVIPGLCVAGLTAVAMGAGLDRAEPIGPYLDGALPSLAPTAASGNWELVNAFPNLVVVDPVQMIPVPGARQLMIAEKWGALVVVADDPETDRRDVILDLSAQVQAEGDSGLLGVAFHPEFGQEGSPNRETLFVYYRYTPEKSELNRAYCRLSRFSWAGGLASIDPASEEVLINQYDRHNWHNGGSLFFGADGFLYFAIGDEGGSNDLFGVAQHRDGGLFSGVFRIDVDRDPTRSHPIRRQPVDAEAPPAGWPGSYTQGYFIPDDNPWPSPDGSALEEYWALGLRSPFRMTIDPPTGTIWLGDVGQSQEEELNRVERGANFQWPFREGTAEGAHPRPASFTGVETPPAFRYGRGEGGCVIGGYVYRGSEHPSLVGKYLFGDYNNGRIRSLTETQEGEILVEDLVELGDQQLTSFGVDARGELYLLTLGQTNLNGGIIHRLRRNGTARPQPPATLSATGAFRDLTTLAPREGVMAYDLIQPLWSDGADKRRWLAIPNDGNPDTEGEQIGFSANGPWDFPVGTVLIKHFEYAGRRLETRFLVRGEDGKFFGFTYQWRADHSDADLLPGPAVVEDLELGGGQSLRWHFPGRFECFECHNEASGLVLGPKTRHLNRDHFYPQTGRTANQLETLASLGFFRNAPSPFAADDFLKAANLSDETESLDRRARSYLDINCSHCHLPGGPVQIPFDMRLTTPPHFQNLIGVDPGNDLGLANAKVVKPGAPGESVLLYRMSSTDTCCAMPPIAKNAVDEAAVSVLTRWIASLDPAVSSSGRNDDPVPSDLAAPRIELSLPGGTPVDGAFDVTVSA